MKTIAAFFFTVIAVCAISAFVTTKWINHQAANINDPHEWLHGQLNLTSEQHDALKPLEKRFKAAYGDACVQMCEARRELARAIGQGPVDSPEVAAAVHKIHLHMGELQMLSLRHLFEMRTVLTKEQGDRLLRLAQESLEDVP